MPQPLRDAFADLAFTGNRLTTAPAYTRIALLDLVHDPGRYAVDDNGIRVGGHCWYTPIDLDPTGMVLICRKTLDRRI